MPRDAARLKGIWQVAPITDAVIRRALASPLTDFEDAVCHAAADEVNAVVIVTRNVSDFAKGAIRRSCLTCFSPIELGLPLQKQTLCRLTVEGFSWERRHFAGC